MSVMNFTKLATARRHCMEIWYDIFVYCNWVDTRWQ